MGAGIGFLGFLLARNRRHIVEVNISLCFPDLSRKEQARLVKDNFRSSGIGIVETANAWLGNVGKLKARYSIEGLENLRQALAGRQGVILLGLHLSTLDLSGAVLSSYIPFDVMYRRNKNPLFEAIMRRGRERNFPNAIDRNDPRAVIKSLRAAHALWYGADQDYGRKHSVFAPFFGIEAATITATARLAKMTGAKVVFFTHYRDDSTLLYRIRLGAPLNAFPSGDEYRDAARLNLLIEQAVRQQPDQYWWLHRRFKTRPAGEQRPY